MQIGAGEENYTSLFWVVSVTEQICPKPHRDSRFTVTVTDDIYGTSILGNVPLVISDLKPSCSESYNGSESRYGEYLGPENLFLLLHIIEGLIMQVGKIL